MSKSCGISVSRMLSFLMMLISKISTEEKSYLSSPTRMTQNSLSLLTMRCDVGANGISIPARSETSPVSLS
ncbi:hypothetical protein KC19_5G187400 [Ceratodon purpureus]|uniref:Secreted protein n=1 Tax=Ceratodon purpureus TaxID=3225 RepID=A0A8T0I492_CERPU|nr:hypothetical protein KC19_5G187400 [Ceratodon purpureus]